MIAHSAAGGKPGAPGDAIPLVLAIVAIALVWALAAAALDLWGATRRPLGGYGAIVVAGAPALPDGRPSGALARRVRKAAELWKQGVAPRLVLTGGPGPGGHTEAGVAASLATSLGIPGEAIVIEDVSLSTEDNARLSAARLDARPVLVVSDSYHVLRCRLVFRRHFPAAHAVGAPPPLAPRVKMAMREVVVLLIYAAQGRLHR